MSQPKFIIITPSFNENVGGVIALHLLCHRLNVNGIKAFIFDINQPIFKDSFFFINWWRKKKYHRKRAKGFFKHNSEWETPEISKISNIDKQEFIFIYPEIIQGNPLKAKKIVRWFLYNPRYDVYYDEGGKCLDVFYSNAWIPKNHRSTNLLRVTWFQSIYLKFQSDKQFNQARNGICYQIRKNDSNSKLKLPSNAVNIDGLDHLSISRIFESHEFFYSYDLYSMYSAYASLCGCKSIVLPKEDMTKEIWYPNEEDRYGLAYGDDQIEWSIQTRPLLIKRIKGKVEEEHKQLINFVNDCNKFFLT
jgi:hypothetical protein